MNLVPAICSSAAIGEPRRRPRGYVTDAVDGYISVRTYVRGDEVHRGDPFAAVGDPEGVAFPWCE